MTWSDLEGALLIMGVDGRFGHPQEGDERQERTPECEPPDRRTLPRTPSETRTRPEYYDALVSGRGADLPGFRLSIVPPAVERPEWQGPLSGGEVDRCGHGVSDERAKKFSPAERRIAEYLACDGMAIVSVSEGFGRHGRTPDARADDVPVEFKSLDPGASDRTVKAALNSAKGQARHAVIDARDSGLSEEEAHRGIRRFSGSPHGHRLDAALIIGDNYHIEWKRAD